MRPKHIGGIWCVEYILNTHAFVGFYITTNKQCYYDLCILLNLKCGFLADVFGKLENGNVSFRNEQRIL
jgi:hypothetical protein